MPEIFHNKFAIAIVVAVVAVVGWMMLGGGSSTSDTSVIQGTTQATVGDDLIQTLTTLQGVTLDGSIFSNPLFTSLQDNTRQIVNEPAGRHDPFAPISLSQNGVATSTVPVVSTSQHATSSAASSSIPFIPKTSLPRGGASSRR